MNKLLKGGTGKGLTRETGKNFSCKAKGPMLQQKPLHSASHPWGHFLFPALFLILLIQWGCAFQPDFTRRGELKKDARETATDLVRGLSRCEPLKKMPVVEVGEVGGNFRLPPGTGMNSFGREDALRQIEAARRAMILFREFLVDQLVNSRSVEYVTASEVKRRELSQERLFQMRHARSSTIHGPGELVGADFGVVAHFVRESRHVISAHLEALDFSSNQVCWSRIQRIRY